MLCVLPEPTPAKNKVVGCVEVRINFCGSESIKHGYTICATKVIFN